MSKRIKKFNQIKVGDIVTFYTWSEGSYVVEKQFYKATDTERQGFGLRIVKVDKRGRYIYDWWGALTEYLIPNSAMDKGVHGYLYLDPTEICQKAIEVAKKRKASINKRIMEVQRILYNADE